MFLSCLVWLRVPFLFRLSSASQKLHVVFLVLAGAPIGSWGILRVQICIFITRLSQICPVGFNCLSSRIISSAKRFKLSLHRRPASIMPLEDCTTVWRIGSNHKKRYLLNQGETWHISRLTAFMPTLPPTEMRPIRHGRTDEIIMKRTSEQTDANHLNT